MIAASLIRTSIIESARSAFRKNLPDLPIRPEAERHCDLDAVAAEFLGLIEPAIRKSYAARHRGNPANTNGAKVAAVSNESA
jgi:hypothetical protein